jgi:hypothetical protein
VNPHQSEVWGNDQYILYPHFIFHVSLGGWWLHRFWPLAPGRTYWEAVYHFERPTSLRNQILVGAQPRHADGRQPGAGAAAAGDGKRREEIGAIRQPGDPVHTSGGRVRGRRPRTLGVKGRRTVGE